MICMTLDYVRPTQSSVIQTIHYNVGLKRFFNFTKMFVIFIVIVYRCICVVVGYVIIMLLQIVRRVCQ